MTVWRDLPSFFSVCDTVALFSDNTLAPSIFRFVYGYTIDHSWCVLRGAKLVSYFTILCHRRGVSNGAGDYK
jgi:hypothetical protein